MQNDDNKACAVTQDDVAGLFTSSIGKDNGEVEFGIQDGTTFPSALYKKQATTPQDCYNADAFFYVQFTCIQDES